MGGGNKLFKKVTALESRVGALEGGKPKASIIETWHSGSSWYRKYSDGWIEQGGVIESTSRDYQVTFVKHFNAKVYFVVSVVHAQSNNGVGFNSLGNRITNTSFYFDTANASGSTWYACGY